jgi:hypothetical protein
MKTTRKKKTTRRRRMMRTMMRTRRTEIVVEMILDELCRSATYPERSTDILDTIYGVNFLLPGEIRVEGRELQKNS